MKLKILGSAAAEGIPALFCVCEVCRTARARGGRDIRRRTTYMLGETIMVDWGPDAYNSMISFGLDYARMQHLLITHSHQDHLLAEELAFRRQGFAKLAEGSLLTVHGNGAAESRLCDSLSGDGGRRLDAYGLAFDRIGAGDVRDLGDGVSVECLLADHAGDEEALNFLFRVGDRELLIANDTGWWPDATWERLAAASLNVVVLDATSGLVESSGRNHHNARTVVATRDELAKLGALVEGATFIANHFSHNGGMLHEDLEAFFGPRSILVGYDGMEVEV